MRLPSRRRRRNRTLVMALYLNAGLLAALLVAFLSRGGGGFLGGGSTAMAAPSMPQIGGGGGIYMMPAQFTQYNWGCYVMDIDKQTLIAYEYIQGSKQLRLVAARYFRHDRDLQDFNTTPSPSEIERIVRVGKAGLRGQEQPGNGGDGPATRPDGAGPDTAPATPGPAAPPTTVPGEVTPRVNENGN
jgi:hypothetical protein